MTQRKPKYLSPSAIKKYDSPDEYYLHYLTPNKPPAFKQTDAMAVGSAFDAFIKADLADMLGMNDPELKLPYLLDTQIEEHREFAEEAGAHCLSEYKKSTAYATLTKELERATDICFEGDLYGDVEGVPFRVKPDICFKLDGRIFTGDWKVNNYCSKNKRSPNKGYVDCDGMPHKKAVLEDKYGITINTAVTMDEVQKDWALQLMIGARVLGCKKNFDEVVGIDQLVCDPTGDGFPTIRVARHRCLIDEEFQEAMMEKAKDLWSYIEAGNIFHWMAPEDAKAHMAHLDKQVAVLEDTSELNQWFLENL